MPALALGACLVLAACSSSTSDNPPSGGDCTSHYEGAVAAPTWSALRDALLAGDEWGRVTGIRIQARGPGVAADLGPRAGSDRHVVRVIDLLKANGHRAVQADVWRTDDGAWGAGAWSQCID
jgi:hypothetical protein